MVTTLAKRLTGWGISIPSDKLEPIAKFSETKLRSFDEAISEIIRQATDDSANFGSTKLDEFIAAIIAGLRGRKDALKTAIMGRAEFRALEGAFDVVEERVFQPDGQGLRVRVLNLKPEDVRKDLADAGKPDSTKLYQTLVANEYHRPGGQPNRVVHWVHPVGPNDVDIVEPLLEMAAEAHFALITTERPEVVCPTDHDAKGPPVDFSGLPPTAEAIEAEFKKPENATIHSLQQKPLLATKWLLAVGQTNARRAYHPKTNSCPASPLFREGNGPLRVPASLLADKSIARSYTMNTNGSRMAGFFGGGKHTRPSVLKNGEVMTLDCIINELQEQALKKCGQYCALPWKGKDFAVAFDSVSAFVPIPTGDAQTDADAVLASKLAYTMLSIEIGHILKRELRYARGLTVDCDTIAAMVDKKLNLFVTPDVKSVSQDVLARKPLAKASVTVTSPTPGVFYATATIKPHTLLAGAHVTLKVTAKD